MFFGHAGFITFRHLLSVLSTLGPHVLTCRMCCENSICSRQLDSKISPFIAQPISQLNNLQRLATWDLGNQGIEHIMQLQTLQVIDIGLKSGTICRAILATPWFSCLNLLCLIACTLNDVSGFLSSLQVVRSKEINVRLMPLRPSGSGSTLLTHFSPSCKRGATAIFLSRHFVDLSSKVPVKLDVFTPLHRILQFNQAVHFAGP